ncbi:hypothetical protein [Streptomyces sp. NPDC008001]|uniref:hypothetical protein n=1 Tax=Streptomyces sp. NPDC008001 TaxID=3364804 RepID=UPI0036E87624
MSDKPPGTQHNTTHDSGIQYITSGGDINVYPPGGPAEAAGGRREKGRRAKRPVLLATAAAVAAAATAITLALLPSSPDRTSAVGDSTRAAAGAPAHSAPPAAPASPSASAAGRASSAPDAGRGRPDSGAAPSTVPGPGQALKEDAAPGSRPDDTPPAAVRRESPSDPYPDGTVCAVGDRWTPVPGMTGVDFQPCTYAKSFSGSALFGVTVRNTSNRQAAVAVWVEYWMTSQRYDCSSPFPQDHVVIAPGATWSSQLRNCIRSGLKGEAHRVQASAGVSEEGGNPRYSRLTPSRGVDVYADGRAVPVAYPS